MTEGGGEDVIQIAVCDDEKGQRSVLREILTLHLQLKAEAHEFYEFASGEELCTACRKNSFDLIFLDIEMNGMSGMETARKLRGLGVQTVLIFVTAYPDFVFQGYEVHAFHYILKPYKEKKIRDVADAALREIADREAEYYLIPTGSGSYRQNLREVLYFYSDRRKITAVTKSDKKTFYGKLDELQKELPAYFQRIHQRYLVNMNQVMETKDNSALVGTEILPVSRAHRQEFLIAFAKRMLK